MDPTPNKCVEIIATIGQTQILSAVNNFPKLGYIGLYTVAANKVQKILRCLSQIRFLDSLVRENSAGNRTDVPSQKQSFIFLNCLLFCCWLRVTYRVVELPVLFYRGYPMRNLQISKIRFFYLQPAENVKCFCQMFVVFFHLPEARIRWEWYLSECEKQYFSPYGYVLLTVGSGEI